MVISIKVISILQQSYHKKSHIYNIKIEKEGYEGFMKKNTIPIIVLVLIKSDPYISILFFFLILFF